MEENKAVDFNSHLAMKIASRSTYNFANEGNTITVNFITVNPFTYCTITIFDKDKKYNHYHAGTICSPDDTFNIKTGKFIAFKEALFLRWKDNCYKQAGLSSVAPLWIDYRRFWANILSNVMDMKVEIKYDYSPI